MTEDNQTTATANDDLFSFVLSYGKSQKDFIKALKTKSLTELNDIASKLDEIGSKGIKDQSLDQIELSLVLDLHKLVKKQANKLFKEVLFK